MFVSHAYHRQIEYQGTHLSRHFTREERVLFEGEMTLVSSGVIGDVDLPGVLNPQATHDNVVHR